MARSRWLGAVLLFGAAVALGQEPRAIPGPFRAYVVWDKRTDDGRAKGTNDRLDARNRKDRIHDLVTEHGLNPAILIFSRTTPEKGDAPVAKLILAANDWAVTYRPDRLGAFAVFLTLAKEYPEDDQRSAHATKAEALATDLTKKANSQEDPVTARTGADPKPKPFLVPFGLAASVSEQTKKYDLKDGHDITVIFYHRMKVLETWTYTVDKPPTDEAIKAIGAAVAAELKKR